MSCEDELPWTGGSTLMTYISSAQLDGLTGPISFTEGKRTDFKLDLLKLEHDKMKKVGDWNPVQGLNITDPYAFMQGQYLSLYCQKPTNILSFVILSLGPHSNYEDFFP